MVPCSSHCRFQLLVSAYPCSRVDMIWYNTTWYEILWKDAADKKKSDRGQMCISDANHHQHHHHDHRHHDCVHLHQRALGPLSSVIFASVDVVNLPWASYFNFWLLLFQVLMVKDLIFTLFVCVWAADHFFLGNFLQTHFMSDFKFY